MSEREYNKNLADLRQWADDLSDDDCGGVGLLAWACYELGEAEALKARVAELEETLQEARRCIDYLGPEDSGQAEAQTDTISLIDCALKVKS